MRIIYRANFVLALLLTFFIAGCVGSAQKETSGALSFDEETLGRANPGYIQWLEKQAMLKQTSEFSSVVSGTNLFWLGPYEKPRNELMLQIAPVWFTMDAARTLIPSSGNFMLTLTNSSFLSTMAQVGIRGIHVESMRESGAVWGSPAEQRQLGDDTVSYSFLRAFGTEGDFSTFLRKANQSGIILGDAVIPLATGRGADFFLSTRGVAKYKGTYCMVDIPQEFWNKLPEIQHRSRAVKLDDQAVDSLRRARLLPPSLVREKLALPHTPIKWYATNVVKDVDGNSRRYVYLGYGSEARPLLNWNDPSGAAQRIISGSLIQEIGMQHSAMVSVRVSPLFGIEPDYPGADKTTAGLGNTAVNAAVSMGQQARRYGGWTFLEDNFPLVTIKATLTNGVDFAKNHAVSTAAQVAYATGDARLLRESLFVMEQMGINQQRLINSIQPESYIDLSFPFMFNAENDRAAAFRKKQCNAVQQILAASGADVFFSNSRLYLTPAAYVAAVDGVRDLRNMTEENKQNVAKGLTLLGHVQAMQPGIFMLSAEEMLGVLPLPPEFLEYKTEEDSLRQNVAGAYDLTGRAGNNILTEVGLPKAPKAFRNIDAQLRDSESFASNMRRIIKVRNSLGMQSAKLLQLPGVKNQGVVIQVYQLPLKNDLQAKIVVTVANFSREDAVESVKLPVRLMPEGKAELEDMDTGERVQAESGGFSLSVPARSAHTYVLQLAVS